MLDLLYRTNDPKNDHNEDCMRDRGLLEFLHNQLRSADTAWSVGSFGAVAEFMRDPDELATFRGDGTAISIVTGRGGIRVRAQADLRLFASETPTEKAWNHRVALCLPHELCAMNGRRGLTEIGPDVDSIRVEEREGILFDLGLGLLQIDACIRTTDPGVAAALRPHLGKSVFATNSGALGVLFHASPHRVFISRVARVEVFQKIPTPDGKSPVGPHTHVLPKLLAHGRTHAATEPVPDNWVPCAHCYPPNPLQDSQGRRRAFDAKSHFGFHAMLERYGDPERLALKKRLIQAITEGHEPFAITKDGDRFGRATVRVTLRQLQASDVRSAMLTAWRSVYDPPKKPPDDAPKELSRPPPPAVRTNVK